MRSLLGRFHRPNARSQSEQLFMLNNLGDGSTLSLDFTTGVLDPRLTFTRTTNATFINSQGYVQYADANMLVNSPMQDAATTPSSWNFFGVTGGSISIPSTGSRNVEATASGQQPFAHQSPTVSQSLTYTLSLVVSEIVGTVTYANICAVDGSASRTLWVNGVQITNTATQASTGNYCLVYVAGSGVHQHRIGVGASSATAGACSMTFHSARVQPGSFTTTNYVPSTLTSAYQGPRFDYDPTALTLKGLLIEGAATNLLNWSESFATSGGTNNNWADTNLTRTSTNNTSPRNDATALRITASAGNGTIISSAAIGTSALRTMSVWLRRVTGTGDIQYTLDNGTNWTTQVITSSWVRYSFTATTAAQRVGFRIVTSGDAIELWGAMLEDGSGASSYIPTGASQGSRLVDFCTMPTASFIPSNPYPQTLFVDCIPNTPSSAFLNIARIFDRTGGGAFSYGTEIYYYNASTMTVGRKITASTNTDRSFASGLSYGTRHKFALSIDASSYSGSYDGVTALGVATAPTALATVATHLGIGCSGDSTANSVMFGTIRQIKFYPTALSQSAINTLTTL